MDWVRVQKVIQFPPADEEELDVEEVMYVQTGNVFDFDCFCNLSIFVNLTYLSFKNKGLRQILLHFKSQALKNQALRNQRLQEFVDALGQILTLRILCFENNNLCGEPFLNYIGPCIFAHPSLAQVNLRKNRLYHGAKLEYHYIINALETNTTLEAIDLTKCGLDILAVLLIRQIFASNTTLLHMAISIVNPDPNPDMFPREFEKNCQHFFTPFLNVNRQLHRAKCWSPAITVYANRQLFICPLLCNAFYKLHLPAALWQFIFSFWTLDIFEQFSYPPLHSEVKRRLDNFFFYPSDPSSIELYILVK